MTFGLWRNSAAALAALTSLCAMVAQPTLAASKPGVTSDFRVVTYHYDNLRTGWNSSETALTPATVASRKFKMLAATPLDDQVDAQPLLMTNQPIRGQGKHDVLYVVTENNTLYALDAKTGAVLRSHNFGPPVPYTALPGDCDNNGPEVGITSTPVINQATGFMYLTTYTYRHQQPQYQLHKIDLSTLKDAAAPAIVDATGTLADGSTYRFDPTVSRQRPALLMANGTIYAGFGSFCDVSADRSRGWMLGWNSDTLTRLGGSELTNTRTHSPNSFYLTAVWMSGYGPSVALDGDVFFATGNSDFSGTTYDPDTNIAESVVQLSGDLLTVKSLFTPKGNAFGWRELDRTDTDFGSGGVLLLPAQSGAPSNLAVALGKAGKMYLLNADDLTNGGKSGNQRAYDAVDGGSCWCGESYFQGNDGLGRVVSSGDNVIRVWTVQTTPKLKLIKQSESAAVENGQDPGVFTTVSSNGTQAGSAVIWAVGRPVNVNPGSIKLYAFNPDNGSTLFSGKAGVWPSPDSNADIVPVVANGRVYVASYKTLSIFGLSNGAAASLPRAAPPPELRAHLAPGEHEIFGTVRAINGSKVVVQKRDGSTVTVDTAPAAGKFDKAEPAIGRALVARGTYTAAGVLKARAILHAKSNPAMWYADR
jgi:hypothetical protein